MANVVPQRLEEARTLLQRHFGYPDFRPAQRRVVQSVLAGRDTLAVLPTGGGKSICFQLPALVLGGFTIVVSPLISLMQDQVAA
ncbi:MAG TPA: DEAD/DEAH box helicase, partial [Gemmatimonadales bacterium]